MTIYPNAKINIGLNIINKRSDGFHDLESVFYPVYKLTDKIKISESDKFVLINNGIDLNIDYKQNLIYKAFAKISEKYKIPNIKIELQKNIPTGAGLGGGSADAVFVIKALNEYFNLKITLTELENITSQICSDCPFFIKNKPQFVYETGNKFKNIEIDLSGYFIVIINPGIFISTADAYAGINPSKPKTNLLETIKKPIAEWKNYIFNDFEKTIFNKHKIIAEIKQYLYDKGALYSAMTGSGSSVFGIFDKKITIKNYNNFFVWNNFM